MDPILGEYLQESGRCNVIGKGRERSSIIESLLSADSNAVDVRDYDTEVDL